jgi:FlaA1/EpsC-like NDP-sugar epimerase
MGDEYERKSNRLLAWQQILAHRFHFALDLFVLTAAFVFAYLIDFDFAIPAGELRRGLIQVSFVVLIQFTALTLAGVHLFIWRYVGLSELKAFFKAGFWSALSIILLRLFLPERLQDWRVPFTLIVVDTVLAFGGVLGVRVLRRLIYEQHKKRNNHHSQATCKKPVLLIGAGHAGMLAVREMQSQTDMGLEVKGFVDDEPQKQGSVIQGVKVLGTTTDLARLVRALKIELVVISITHGSRTEFRRLLNLCEQIPVKVQLIPALDEILNGRVKVSRIRDVQIEDILGREAVSLDEDELREFLSGKVVMVTGAGGSIGSEMARQLARFQPGRLLLVERAEFALFNIEHELREERPELSIEALVADIGDELRMRSIFARYATDVVFHAAAHKHVPLMESNSCEAVKNNVLATHLLGKLAGEFGVGAFVLISTDKAVRPTSVMGATKRVAELIVQDLDRKFSTRYVAVRFGNVIGSAGSVIPIFRDQILRGGPLTVTHPDMVRYFMTIPEAAQLVMEAGAMGKGGEIFVLDMGDPVRILDLAKDIIALSGFKPFEEIDIVFTGLRPGEKLFEELGTSDEQVTRTRHPKIFIGHIADCAAGLVQYAVRRLTTLATDEQEQALRRFLNELLPEASLSLAVEESHPDGFESEGGHAAFAGDHSVYVAARELQVLIGK